MNGLFLIVICILLFGAINGYRLGFLRVIYSLFSWILVFAFVTWTTPYITSYIEEHTTIAITIQEKCVSYIEESVKGEETAEEAKAEDATAKDVTLEDAAEEANVENSLNTLLPGINLPKAVVSRFQDSAADTAGQILESSGIYDKIAEGIAHFIIEGIAFFIALIFVSIISRYISSALNLVSRLPIIHGINKLLGVLAGLLKGFAVVWIAFYIIALCCTSELGAQLVTYIQENAFLTYLYDNNIILDIIMTFLG